jgi:Ca2+-binding EF-hand superfamily protein
MFSGMFDRDNSSTIDFNEFKALWNFITQWEKVFRGFDEDRSGTIDKNEFRKALTSFGNIKKNRKAEKNDWIFAYIYISIDNL